nr:helix-turn-helix transcriptional regulator [Corynebacterium auriscanis]
MVANLRNLREAAEMSRGALADAIEKKGLTMYPNTIRRIEVGEQRLKFDEAVAMAEIFGVEVGDLLKGSLENPRPDLQRVLSTVELVLLVIVSEFPKLVQDVETLSGEVDKYLETRSDLPNHWSELPDSGRDLPSDVEKAVDFLKTLTAWFEKVDADLFEDLRKLVEGRGAR